MHSDRCPTKPGIATCSRPSSTLRAGFAGGLQPCLTATARNAIRNLAETEKRPDLTEQRNTGQNRNYWNIGSFAIDSSAAIRELLIIYPIIPASGIAFGRQRNATAWQARPVRTTLVRTKPASATTGRQPVTREASRPSANRNLRRQQSIHHGLRWWICAYKSSNEIFRGLGFGNGQKVCHLLTTYHAFASIMVNTVLHPNDESIYDSQTIKFGQLV